MAEWKKVVVSGSSAELANLEVDAHVSASAFSGSFFGDGSGLTGIAGYTVTNESNNRIVTSTGTGAGNAEANLTFDGTTLTVTGAITATALGTGTDNSVVVVNASNQLVTDEIDSRVWGTTLVDAANGVNNRLATFSDGNSLNGEANLTFDGSTLTVNGGITATGLSAGTDNTVLVLNASNQIVTDEIDSRVWGSTLISGSLDDENGIAVNQGGSLETYPGLTFTDKTLTAPTASITGPLTVGGDLIVQGDLTYLNTTNTAVEDQFILLGSGSTDADVGIIFQTAVAETVVGTAFFLDSGVSRLSYAYEVAHDSTAVTPAAYIPLVFDVTGASHTPITDVGNIKIEDGEAYIYV